MIDARTEKLVKLADVPALSWIPPRRTGVRLAAGTVRNWVRVGRRGVKLERLVLGGTSYTSEEALQRFFERLTCPALPEKKLTPAQAKKSYDRAREVCQAAGI